MRAFKFLLIISVIVVCGYGVYHFGMNFVSAKIADTVTEELDNEESMNDVKKMVDGNTYMKDFIEEGASVKESDLTFTTKEEATKVIIKKVGISELQKIQSKIQNGMTQAEIQALLMSFEGKLSQQEILSLKALAYKELNK